ncbi:surfeit locus protein 6 [Gadus chalcogrammus]|uniref:surfeit locus protein 6 n=1 Tax=Gadus chalcogrammus TaxID=1042646 RepID=UPI0024C493DB|nr:surfeit locus protein 6 [Gadus chalcogrammus]
MSNLASKDSYIQKLASKICARQDHEPRNSKFVHFKGEGDGTSKNSKRKQKRLNQKAVGDKKDAQQSKRKSVSSPDAKSTSSPAATAATQTNGSKIVANGKTATTQLPKGGGVTSGFSTVDLLRKRLHEKIEESKGQGTQDSLSEAVQAKRAKRKLERERKKRKRKEFLVKRLAEKAGEELAQQIKDEENSAAAAPAPAPAPPAANKRDETAILFNTVETVDEVYMDKMTKKKIKKKLVKGELTPLTGRNYKQLLGRVEARKAKLEDLRATDEGKARAMEEKMKWTNVLYKAEGLRIKDDEGMLRTSLKKKEKSQETKQRRWDTRKTNVDDKMQRRQDKRRRNLQKQKSANVEKKKDRARKKGRVLPGDLKKVSLK